MPKVFDHLNPKTATDRVQALLVAEGKIQPGMSSVFAAAPTVIHAGMDIAAGANHQERHRACVEDFKRRLDDKLGKHRLHDHHRHRHIKY